MLHQIFNFSTIFRRKTITCCIRNIHDCSTSCNNSFYHTSQIFIVCSACIFCIKFHIIYIATCITYRLNSPLNNFFSTRIELVTDMCIRSTNTSMDTFTFSKTQSLGCNIYIAFNGTCQSTNGWPCHSL